MNEIGEGLARYFGSRDDVSFALLFGSRATGAAGPESDWDIAVYFREPGRALALED
jgi:predicted nucleotidyltransferase